MRVQAAMLVLAIDCRSMSNERRDNVKKSDPVSVNRLFPSLPPSEAFLTAKSGAQVTDENVHNGRKGGRERLLLQQERCITSLRDLILSDE